MDCNGQVSMTPDQRHVQVMKSVLSKLQDTNYVLKGGTALLLTRGLNRHSTDLDFDSAKKMNIGKRIQEGFKASGVSLVSFKTVKDTQTVQRFKAHYINPETGENTLLKIETSFRDKPDEAQVESVNKIRTYKLGKIYDQKMEAAENRTAPRDLFDIAFLVDKHGDKLSSKQIMKADDYSHDMNGLAERFGKDFQDDTVLKSTTVDETVLVLREAIEREKFKRVKQVEASAHRAVKVLKNPDLKNEAQNIAQNISKVVKRFEEREKTKNILKSKDKDKSKDNDFER